MKWAFFDKWTQINSYLDSFELEYFFLFYLFFLSLCREGGFPLFLSVGGAGDSRHRGVRC